MSNRLAITIQIKGEVHTERTLRSDRLVKADWNISWDAMTDERDWVGKPTVVNSRKRVWSVKEAGCRNEISERQDYWEVVDQQ